VLNRVLVVEDSDLITSALKIVLESSGYEVSIARTAAEATDIAAAISPDMMLLDLTLPDGDGLSVLNDLAASGVSPPVTLAITGEDDDVTRARCIAAGCSDVLLKPVPIRELIRIIAERMK
jgi:DNA-binding response OmpR family regulator